MRIRWHLTTHTLFCHRLNSKMPLIDWGIFLALRCFFSFFGRRKRAWQFWGLTLLKVLHLALNHSQFCVYLSSYGETGNTKPVTKSSCLFLRLFCGFRDSSVWQLNVNKKPVHFATCCVLKYFLVRSEDELSVERIAYFVYCGQISPV